MALSFWNRFFGREEIETSKTVAKERLRLVLVHDRLDMSEQVMNSLREDLIAVIGKYLIIDEKALDVTLSREEEGMALVANIPILNVRPAREEETALPKEPSPTPPKPAPARNEKSQQQKKPAAAKSGAAKA